MTGLIKELKGSIYSNGKLSIPGTLFTLAEPIGFIGIYIAFKHAEECAKNNDLFDDANLYLVLALTLAYICRIPYMWNKPLARILLFVNVVGWAYVTYLYFRVYMKKNKGTNTENKLGENNTREKKTM
jgi:hypothetical protein